MHVQKFYLCAHAARARGGPDVSPPGATLGGRHEQLGRRRRVRAADVRVRSASDRLLAGRHRVEQLDGAARRRPRALDVHDIFQLHRRVRCAPQVGSILV